MLYQVPRAMQGVSGAGAATGAAAAKAAKTANVKIEMIVFMFDAW